MKLFCLLTCLVCRGDWNPTNQVFYTYPYGPGTCQVAITTNLIFQVHHVAASVPYVMLGNYQGTTDTNRVWTGTHAFVSDYDLFTTTAPMTNVAYVSPRLAAGDPVWWLSNNSHVWLRTSIHFMGFNNGTNTLNIGGVACTFGTLGIYGSVIGGDSGSPVFNNQGDFVGVMQSTYPGGGGVAWAYPSGSSVRPQGLPSGTNGPPVIFKP